VTRSPPASVLPPLEPLLEMRRGRALPLPTKLARLYGSLRLPVPGSHPLVFSNFVSTLDGVVSLRTLGHAGGGDISGFDGHDRMVMGLLRAVADAVVVGSGTLSADRSHIWTAEDICPEFAPQYQRLRKSLGKHDGPLNVIVSGSGHLDLGLPVFCSSQIRSLILTTSTGARRLARQRSNATVAIRAIHRGDSAIPAQAILAAILRANRASRILIEGGPTLLGDFFSQDLIDEQFLTLAPQIAGREPRDGRLTLVMGQSFAPLRPLWGTLTDVRRNKSHLFLRYSFTRHAGRGAKKREA
jgi:riboflavin biosynthesis pyrimidine reductase